MSFCSSPLLRLHRISFIASRSVTPAAAAGAATEKKGLPLLPRWPASEETGFTPHFFPLFYSLFFFSAPPTASAGKYSAAGAADNVFKLEAVHRWIGRNRHYKQQCRFLFILIKESNDDLKLYQRNISLNRHKKWLVFFLYNHKTMDDVFKDKICWQRIWNFGEVY